MINGELKTELSVSGCLTLKLKEEFDADDVVFVSSGREDADVLMLGTGRPFYVVILNPKRSADLQEIQQKVNEKYKNKVQFQHLCDMKKESKSCILEGEQSKKKRYKVLVSVQKDVIDVINQQKNITLQQKTPIRVLHRRANLVREKTIYWMKCISGKNLEIELEAQAGTYIKEFIHGDFGRTKPSLADICGCNVEFLQLDGTVFY